MGVGRGLDNCWVGSWPLASAWYSLQCLPPFSVFLHPLETMITSTTWMRVKVSVTSLMCLFSTSDRWGHALCGWDRLFNLRAA